MATTGLRLQKPMDVVWNLSRFGQNDKAPRVSNPSPIRAGAPSYLGKFFAGVQKDRRSKRWHSIQKGPDFAVFRTRISYVLMISPCPRQGSQLQLGRSTALRPIRANRSPTVYGPVRLAAPAPSKTSCRNTEYWDKARVPKTGSARLDSRCQRPSNPHCGVCLSGQVKLESRAPSAGMRSNRIQNPPACKIVDQWSYPHKLEPISLNFVKRARFADKAACRQAGEIMR